MLFGVLPDSNRTKSYPELGYLVLHEGEDVAQLTVGKFVPTLRHSEVDIELLHKKNVYTAKVQTLNYRGKDKCLF